MKLFRIRAFFLAAMTAALLASRADCADITIKMDDLPNQPVNGLVHPTGVQFGFTVGGNASADARYASGGPGPITFVQDPSIEGSTAGILSIIFPTPTPIVRFGAARSELAAIPVGAAVQLFDASNAIISTTNLAMSPMPTFPEGQFSYSGVPVKRATVDFTTATTSERFAFDNLVFRTVPEPATAMLGGMAAVFGLIASWRRRR